MRNLMAPRDITPHSDDGNAAARRRSGSTLVEQVVLIAVVGVCLAASLSRASRALESAAVHSAAREVVELFSLARDRAMATGSRSAVRFDGAGSRVVVHIDADTIARLDLRVQFGVSLEATRDSMAYQASGLAYGAANLRVILTRGASRDTITVSRLGRVRR